MPGWMRAAAPAVAGALLGLATVALFMIWDSPAPEGPRPAVGRSAAPEPTSATKQASRPDPRNPRIRIERRDSAAKTELPWLPATPPQPPLPPRQDAQPVKEPARLPAWRRFAVAAPAAGGRPLIAVIIDDMGVDQVRSARAVGLPGPLTLSYLPYADAVVRQTAAARRAGHELMVHISMEPESAGPDPGPNVLAAGLGAREVRRRLVWALGRFSGFVGINNHMGSRFTADPQAMALVMTEIMAQGLLFVDSRTTTRTVAGEAARLLGAPFAERDVFIDDQASAETIAAQLGKMEEIARRTGAAIAIGHPRDATLNALEPWLAALAQRGFVLAPVSAVILRRRQAQTPGDGILDNGVGAKR